MDLSDMTLTDLVGLRTRLDQLAKAGQLLEAMTQAEGLVIRFDLTPGEVAVITTQWRMPTAPLACVCGEVPDFELIDPDTPLSEIEDQAAFERFVGLKDDAAKSGAGAPAKAEVGGGGAQAAPPPAPLDLPAATSPVAAAAAEPFPNPPQTPTEVAPEATPVGGKVGLWTSEEEARALRMRREGWTIEKIATALNRPVGGTKQKLTRLAAREQNTSGPAIAGSVKGTPISRNGPKGGVPHAAPDAAPAVSKPAPDAGGAGDFSKPSGGRLQVAPVRAAEAAPRPLWWRELEDQLAAISGPKCGWTPEEDLALVEGIALGQPAELTADQCGHAVKDCRARFIGMTPDAVDRKGNRRVTPEMQAQLLQVLRARAEDGAE
ncbi:hypothetical protein SAMN05877809_10723 [Rhodobacter sp. JA431]|uniref:hypothetical protein n=1 Tax=Rhodobacter sp. JA431 TaxID=570013 RepID=UPI000BD37845|nr:hypothetical protein [Rhodobacter sp. JA431]SOC13837.1 hypothetical protein SAMN05877809_10723 [Rhodobacter sp. JA431]